MPKCRWKHARLVLLPLVLAGAPGTPAAVSPPSYDLVIRNGRVLDGAGNPWVQADIAITGGRFVRIGRIESHGRREIDAGGDYVTPGWIDMMDQSGRILQSNGRAENKVLMGVTTVIAGEGGTPVPAERIAEYFDGLGKKGISVNFGTYYSASQARVAVMGDAAGTPSTSQLEEMKAKVDTAMRNGALGLTTALIYPPSTFQSTSELIELMKVAARYDGIYASHIRDESAGLLKGVGEAIEIGEKTGAQVEIFHLKGAYQPGWGKLLPQAGAMIETARARGVNVAADLYPYTAGGTGLDATIPTWVFDKGVEVGIARLRDPAIRARLKREVAAGSRAGWSNLVEASGGWKGVVLGNAFNTKYARFESRNIADIARELGRDPADVAWDIVVDARPKRAVALYFMIGEQDIERALRYPWTSIGSDAAASAGAGKLDDLGLPHPRAYGTFPRVIAHYVKAKPVLSLEEAVRKMTSWPASRMRLYDRGVIRAGLRADVTIFNFARLEDTATYERPTSYPTGIDYVIVNGCVTAEHGHHTGATCGQVIRGAGYQGVRERE